MCRTQHFYLKTTSFSSCVSAVVVEKLTVFSFFSSSCHYFPPLWFLLPFHLFFKHFFVLLDVFYPSPPPLWPIFHPLIYCSSSLTFFFFYFFPPLISVFFYFPFTFSLIFPPLFFLISSDFSSSSLMVFILLGFSPSLFYSLPLWFFSSPLVLLIVL